MDYGAISLVPTALVLILAIWSHRTLESVIAGAIVAFLIMDGWQFADRLATVTTEVLADEVTAWVVLVCALYGSFIASRYAEDRTGQSPTVCNVGMGQFFNAAYRASMHRKEPLFTRHAPPPDSKVKACQRLILPFRRPEFDYPIAR